MSGHDREALALLALGTPDGSDPAVVAHLAECATCRQELRELREITDVLGEVPPEMLIDGPPEGGDLLVERAVARVRRERRRSDRLRFWTRAAAAAAVVLLAVTGGVLIGQKQTQTTVIQASAPTATGGQSQPPGIRVGSATDAATGAAMTVRMTPAAGWVRLNLAVTGIPAGQVCRIWVIADSGRREQAGSWVVSQTGARDGTALDAAAAVPPERVTSIEIDNLTGDRFVTVPL